MRNNKTQKIRTATQLLDYMNSTYPELHEDYEKAFWLSYMGDHSVDKKMNETQVKRDAFRANADLRNEVQNQIKRCKGETKRHLLIWDKFFSLYQTPAEALTIKEKATALDAEIMKIKTSNREGYIDPASGKFIEASENKMKFIMRNHADEPVRKACFDALEKLPLDTIDKYIEVIKLRNEFARALGFEDFYAYKARIDEDMTKDELFSIFNDIYEKTRYAFDDVRKLEKEYEKQGKPGLRKPWNFVYMMTGDFAKEEDQYYPYEDALMNWGRSFASLGIGFMGGTVTMDLLDRKGKHNNGFCHYPKLVHYDGKIRIPGSSGIASNTVLGQPGAASHDMHVLFHEGGHAADRLNTLQREVCVNHEYPPSSVSWAETHSMFMDAMYFSIEWRSKYAKNHKGEFYPFELFEKKLRKVYPLRPLDLMYILFVVFFEKEVYECKNLTKDVLLEMAKKVFRKYVDRSEDSIVILNLPHIYSWESSAYYHGYGMAELAVHQWREYFYNKYGYIVDNPKVGKEMTKIWSYASLYPAKKLVMMATGKPLSADAFIRSVTKPLGEILEKSKMRVRKQAQIKVSSKPIDLDGRIIMVHGKQKIADSKKSFEDMAMKYSKWLRIQRKADK